MKTCRKEKAIYYVKTHICFVPNFLSPIFFKKFSMIQVFSFLLSLLLSVFLFHRNLLFTLIETRLLCSALVNNAVRNEVIFTMALC